YQHDLNLCSMRDALAQFWQTQENTPDEVRKFAEELLQGAVEHQVAIDEKNKKYTEHWEIDRIAAVDRNVLRLAIYEMLFREDIPPVVSINEAIELAKMFGGGDSGRFVNGILDRVKDDLSRPLREAVPAKDGNAK